MSDSALHYDDGKLPWALIPFDALREVGKVFQAGDKKYPDPPRNWERGMLYSKLINSTMRHLFGDPGKHNGWWYRDDIDSETKCLHLAQAITDLMFLMTYEVRGLKQYDDRPTLSSNLKPYADGGDIHPGNVKWNPHTGVRVSYELRGCGNSGCEYCNPKGANSGDSVAGK